MAAVTSCENALFEKDNKRNKTNLYNLDHVLIGARYLRLRSGYAKEN